jgi:hypothetical protein
MPHHEQVKHSGTVGDVFAHRFVLEMSNGNVLADLGPRGAETFRLKEGEHVHIEGEKKPSEIKLRAISRDGGERLVIDHPKPPHEHEFADPKIALRAAEQAGFDVIGEPHRKPKHFEVRAHNSKRQMVELHIELDGHIRKEKRVE